MKSPALKVIDFDSVVQNTKSSKSIILMPGFSRARLKNAFCKMCITICGRFRLNEGGVVGYGNRMKAKYTVNWGVHLAGMIFQTRSNILLHSRSFKTANIEYLIARVLFPGWSYLS